MKNKGAAMVKMMLGVDDPLSDQVAAVHCYALAADYGVSSTGLPAEWIDHCESTALDMCQTGMDLF